MPRDPDGLPRVVGSGIDTMVEVVRVPVRPEIVAELEAAKDLAQASKGKRRDPPVMTLGGLLFEVMPHGAAGAPFLLANEHMAVAVAPAAPEPLPTVLTTHRSLFLWQVGAIGAHQAALAVVADLCEPLPSIGPDGRLGPPRIALSIARIDHAADFQGWVPPAAPEVYTTHIESMDVHYRRREYTGLSFGRGAIVVRIYCKTAEIAKKGEKTWFFPLWSQSPEYVPGQPVWRLEFQSRRDFIRTIAIRGSDREIRTIDDMLSLTRSYWRELTTSVLSIRSRTARNRRRLSPEWSALSESAFPSRAWPGADVDLYRIARHELAGPATARCAGLAVGEFARVALKQGRPVNVEEMAADVIRRFVEHGERTGRPFAARANKLAKAWQEADRMGRRARKKEPQR